MKDSNTNSVVEVYANDLFGNLRTIVEDDKILFCGSDVAKALGYKKPQKAISDHCKNTCKRQVPHPQSYTKTIAMLFVTEGDLYRLITRSKLPHAERFERWVFDCVLPAIRKKGISILPAASLECTEFPAPEVHKNNDESVVQTFDLCNPDDLKRLKDIEDSVVNPYVGYFYLLEYGDDLKIGSTKYPYRRMVTLKSQTENYSDKSVHKVYFSQAHTNYEENEKYLHQVFSAVRIDRSERFRMSLSACLNQLASLPIKYKDDSDKLVQRSEVVYSYFVNHLFGCQTV